MRTNGFQAATEVSKSGRDPPPTAIGTVLFAALVVAVPVAASFPVETLGVVASGLLVRRGVYPLLGRVRDREIDPVCVPGTNVCLRA